MNPHRSFTITLEGLLSNINFKNKYMKKLKKIITYDIVIRFLAKRLIFMKQYGLLVF